MDDGRALSNRAQAQPFGRVSRRRLAGGSALAAAGLLAACRGAAPSAKTGQSATIPKLGGQIRLRLTEDPQDWDVSLLGKGSADGIFFAYDNLVAFKAGSDIAYTDAKLAPELAESWEIQDGGRTFIFHVREGVKWANAAPVNGRSVTSNDIKWSYEYWTRSGQFAGKNLQPAQWAWMFEGLDHIETPDDQTAVARFKKPFVPFVPYTAAERGSPIVPHEIYDANGNLSNVIAGTGPFQMDAANTQRGSQYQWAKNPTFWDSGKPYIDQIRQLVVPDDASAEAAFRTKQLDVLGDVGDGWNISFEDGERIKRENPAAGTLQSMHPKPLLLYINVEKEPFNDMRARQALSLSIDRDEFVNTFTGGKGGWALYGAMAGLFSQQEVRSMLKYDPAQAKSMLAAAGYPNGVDVEFIYPGKTYGDRYISEIQLFQSQLRKGGFNVTLKDVQQQQGALKQKHNFQMTMNPGSTIDGDIDAWVYGDFYPGSQKNYQGVNDPSLAQMLDEQRAESDSAKRLSLLRDIVRYINVEKVWGLSVYHELDYIFWQPTIKNYYPNFWTKRWNVVNRWIDSSG
jgi:peptide/nickel transport system substrate-binding protein